LEKRIGAFEPATGRQSIPYPGDPDFPASPQADPLALSVEAIKHWLVGREKPLNDLHALR